MAVLSVIVPVYNTEKYLPRCLESILGQSLQDMEILCVDDGSTDASPAILERYARKDPRVHVIRKENGGLVSARKAGVKAAKGRYIGYVDSDDWIERDMYEKLCGYASETQADMVSSGYLYEGGYITTHYDDVPEGLYGREEMEYLREHAIYHTSKKEVGIRGSLCCKIFLAEKFRKVQLGIPEEISMSEDKLCILSYLLCCERVAVKKEAYYHYMLHEESMVHKPDPGYLLKVNGVYQYLLKLYAHPLFTGSMRMQSELYITELLYKGINTRLGFENRNLLWIDPYWLCEIPHGSKVVLYGGGELGEAYRRQLGSRKDLSFVGCMDFNCEKYREGPMPASGPESFSQTGYDVVVITIKNPRKAGEVKEQLMEAGISGQKIRWFEQKEIYWKFAEANGWLG